MRKLLYTLIGFAFIFTSCDKQRNPVDKEISGCAMQMKELFNDEIKCNPSKAIELGCGAGNDTVYLIKNNWNVLAIDRENVEDRIRKRLNEEEIKRFRFQRQDFENIVLEENNLLVANFCLPFCNKNRFYELWDKINKSILPNRIFCR